jgi:hypothetical protein
VVERAEQLVHAPVDGLDLLAAQKAARDATLVRDDGEPHAGGAKAVERGARPRDRLHPARVAVVGDVDDEGAVAVEEDRIGPRAPAASEEAR